MKRLVESIVPRVGAKIGGKWQKFATWHAGRRQLPPGMTRLKSGKASQRRTP